MQPLLLNVDWLALSVRFHADQFNDLREGYFFVDYDGTNVWAKRRIVFNEYSEKVCTLLYKPKSKVIPSNAGLLEISNEWLYHGKSPNDIIEIICEWRIFTITGMSRVDLAVDFTPTAQQLHRISQLATGKAYVGGKRSGSSFWSVVRCPLLADRYQGKKICHCQSWGHKTTQVKWKLYFKSKELADIYGGKMMAKPYILDCWEDAGLDRRDVWRLEVSIKDANQLMWRGQPLTYDELCQHPREIFQALYTERFDVRKNQGHADRTNDAAAPFLPVGKAGGIKCAKAKGTNRRNPTITLLRHLISSLDNEEILCHDDTRELLLDNVCKLVEQNELGNYFRVIVGENVYSWMDAQRLLAEEIKERHEIPEKKNLRDIMARQAAATWGQSW